MCSVHAAVNYSNFNLSVNCPVFTLVQVLASYQELAVRDKFNEEQQTSSTRVIKYNLSVRLRDKHSDN